MLRDLLLIGCVAASVFFHTTVIADESREIQFVEDFVLSSDRAKTLSSLIPGTDLYYFYQALHLQNEREFGAVTRVLNTWRQRHGQTRLYKEIRNRQMLLTYSKNPKQTLDFLVREIRPNLNHQRQSLETTPTLPNTLDEKQIDFQVLKKKYLRESKDLQAFLDTALQQLSSDELSPEQRRQLLSRIRIPNHPDLLEMILADLRFKGSRGFGSLAIHRNLTLEQLDQLADRLPTLRNQTNFVNILLTKLQPNHDVDWRNNPEEHRAYLQRLWSFVQDLAPAHSSAKTLVLFHWLRFDETQGRYDRERFRQYLTLPRPSAYILPAMLDANNARRYAADLSFKIQGCPLAPIGDDEPLVRRYLLEFLRRDSNYGSFAGYIKEEFLKSAFAEAKITNGLGNPENWYSLISPSEYQAFKDRVDLDFAATNPAEFNSSDAVEIDLWVKNVSQLIVKVYEVNTQNYYRDLGRQVNTDIQLDGLIPNYSFNFDYEDSPFLRKKRSFQFPQLEKPASMSSTSSATARVAAPSCEKDN